MENESYIWKMKGVRKIEQLIYIFLTEREYWHWNKSLVRIWNPRRYTEKLNYLRIYQYCDNPKVTECVDKYAVKKYLKRIGKDELCAKTYGVYDRVEEIDWKSLPKAFVLKCNHGSGYNYVCKDKDAIEPKKLEKVIKGWMAEDYWKKHTELVYKNVKKRILIEEYLGDNIQTYRFCCFNGRPKVVYIATTTGGKDYFDYYDLKWQKLKINENQGTGKTHKRPDHLEEMIELSAELSKPFPFVRVDLYETHGKIWFSEFTFLPAGGYFIPYPLKYDQIWGRWLKL